MKRRPATRMTLPATAAANPELTALIAAINTVLAWLSSAFGSLFQSTNFLLDLMLFFSGLFAK